MIKSYIWSLPTRVFHISLIVFTLLAFLTSEEDNLLNYHAFLGYAILVLIFFRVIWGFIGPKYSKFKDFPLSIKKAKEFTLNIFDKEQKYIGHNPAASFVMIATIITIFLVILTGVLAFGVQEGKGVFSFLNDSFFKNMKLFKEIHEVFTNILIALIALHILGVLSDKLLHSKHGTLNSIFSGYKNTKKDESIKLNLFQKTVAMFFVILFVAFLIFNLMQPKNILMVSKYKPIDYTTQNEFFVEECASCHTLYPPNLLPKNSWITLMGNLENHFGDDASLDEETRKDILAFLVKNSAETSTKEASIKILNSLKNEDIIAVTKTPFWKRVHRKIPKKVFEHAKVKSKANCKACHINIEKGLIEDEEIKNISSFM